ncbi:MAG: aminotransferase class V-fold PLP-dependent enzyme [Bryobacterales bacterium]|nr:aminotransferase class V-fold PLP-dependent enzyme [Bryobacterales bacterium]
MHRRNFLASTVGFQTGALALAQAAAPAAATESADQSARNESYWRQIRQAFTLDPNIINLNAGTISPAPRHVQDMMYRYMELASLQPAYYSDELLIPQVERVRRRLAGTFGCDPEEIAVMRNATEALQAVQLGLNLKQGDEVLTTTQDYPSTLTGWRQRQARDGIVLKTISFPTPPPSPDDLLHRFEKAITPRTRVILFCQVTYTTGQMFPVRQICEMARAKGIETIVDGAHGFAQFPFRYADLRCDYYGSSLHKWLMAPAGTGFLFVRREKIGKVWPLNAAPLELKENIRKFEATGVSAFAIRSAITDAIDFHEAVTVERKAARLRYLRQYWTNRVQSIPGVRILNRDDPAMSCGLGAMTLEGWDSNKLTGYLMKEYRVHVRSRYVPNEFHCIRVTPNIYSTLEELETFVNAVERAAKTRA